MNSSESPASAEPALDDVETFRSTDGLVRVRVKSRGLRRWPRHDYPCVVMELRPRPATRVAALTDGSAGVEVMFTHQEIRALLEAINIAAGRRIYESREVKGKPAERVRRWAAINHSRRSR